MRVHCTNRTVLHCFSSLLVVNIIAQSKYCSSTKCSTSVSNIHIHLSTSSGVFKTIPLQVYQQRCQQWRSYSGVEPQTQLFFKSKDRWQSQNARGVTTWRGHQGKNVVRTHLVWQSHLSGRDGQTQSSWWSFTTWRSFRSWLSQYAHTS